MSAYTLEELKEAHRALLSTLKKCEKVASGSVLGRSQTTLLTRRIAALSLALELIEREIELADRSSENSPPGTAGDISQ